jgi:protein tyrosine phosphatase (PTP) superfamily phosphohydrolase (DUF442 family)
VAPNEPLARVENRWQPSDSKVQLGAPEPVTSADWKSQPRLYPPGKATEPPLAQIPNPQSDNTQSPNPQSPNPQSDSAQVPTPQSPSPQSPAPQGPAGQSPTALPVGIPQFAIAMEKVAAGLRPSLDDGLDWLQARGYKTVVHVRLPTDNDSTDRKQVEKRGMKYVNLEVSPQTLTKEKVAEFGRLVGDASLQPLFVYDKDGALAGGLWYLYFRTILELPNDVARIRAGALGLREDREGAHREMWLAVQKYLSES